MWWVCFLASVMFVLLLKKRQICSLTLPHISMIPFAVPSLVVRLFARALNVAAVGFLMLSFVHFVCGPGPLERYIPLLSSDPAVPKQSRILFYAIDRSGSMGETIPDNPETSKIELVKANVRQNISSLDQAGETANILGLVTFARAARIVVPLSMDRQFFLTALGSTTPEKEDRLNGTAIGYAIFKTTQLIAACRQFAEKSLTSSNIIGQSVVVITDGIEEPNPADRNHPYRSMRISQAVRYAAAQKVRVYCINIDRRAYQSLSIEERDTLRQLFADTGGSYIEATPSLSLGKALASIVQEEKPRELSQPFDVRMAYGFTLIAAALFFVIISRLLETLVMRVVR